MTKRDNFFKDRGLSLTIYYGRKYAEWDSEDETEGYHVNVLNARNPTSSFPPFDQKFFDTDLVKAIDKIVEDLS